MPDHIDGKGAVLCLMGAYSFERLEEKGVKTHYRGLVNVKCPNCGNAHGSVEKYKVDKSKEDPIFFVADLKCPKCNIIYNLEVNIYGYEKEHL